MPKISNQPLVGTTPVTLGAVPGTAAANLGANNIPVGDNATKVTIQNPGTAAIFVEGSDDSGVSWHDLAALSTKDYLTVSSNSAGIGFIPPAGKTSSYIVPSEGCNQVRVRPSAVTGNALVSLTSITCPPLSIF